MRRSFVAMLVLVVSVVAACSSETGLVGNGGCDAFCSKVDGASCLVHVTRETCLEKCVYYENDPSASRGDASCSDAESKMIRCATIDGNVGCDGGSGFPRVVGCDPFVSQQQAACRPYFSDAGGPTGP